MNVLHIPSRQTPKSRIDSDFNFEPNRNYLAKQSSVALQEPQNISSCLVLQYSCVSSSPTPHELPQSVVCQVLEP